MTAYLDTSVIVPLFLPDVHTRRVGGWLSTGPSTTYSLWTVAEMTSALAHNVRVGRITASQRAVLESHFDAWIAKRPAPLALTEGAFALARMMMRVDASLRAPDALHLAVVEIGGFELATLDLGLLAAAQRRGLPVSSL